MSWRDRQLSDTSSTDLLPCSKECRNVRKSCLIESSFILWPNDSYCSISPPCICCFSLSRPSNEEPLRSYRFSNYCGEMSDTDTACCNLALAPIPLDGVVELGHSLTSCFLSKLLSACFSFTRFLISW